LKKKNKGKNSQLQALILLHRGMSALSISCFSIENDVAVPFALNQLWQISYLKMPSLT